MSEQCILSLWPTNYGFLFPITQNDDLVAVVDLFGLGFLDLNGKSIDRIAVSKLEKRPGHLLSVIICDLAYEELLISNNRFPWLVELSENAGLNKETLSGDFGKMRDILQELVLLNPRHRLLRILKEGHICGCVDVLEQQVHFWPVTTPWKDIPTMVRRFHGNQFVRNRDKLIRQLLERVRVNEREQILLLEQNDPVGYSNAIHSLLDARSKMIPGYLRHPTEKPGALTGPKPQLVTSGPSKPVRITKEICLDIIFGGQDKSPVCGDQNILMQLRYDCLICDSANPPVPDAVFVVQSYINGKSLKEASVTFENMLRTYDTLWDLVLYADANKTMSDETALIQVTSGLEIGCRTSSGYVEGVVVLRNRLIILDSFWLFEFVYRLARTFAYLKVPNAKSPQSWIDLTGHKPSFRDKCLKF